jgi:hypothetical protein
LRQDCVAHLANDQIRGEDDPAHLGVIGARKPFARATARATLLHIREQRKQRARAVSWIIASGD